MPICKKCSEDLNIDSFSKARLQRGQTLWCKLCVKEYDSERYQKNKEKFKEYKAKYREKIANSEPKYVEYKVCSHCNETKHRNDFGRNIHNVDHLSGKCKSCCKKLDKKYRHNITKVTVKSKLCTKCNKEKSSNKFYKLKRSRDGLAYNCKDCQREEKRKFRKNNREHVRKLKNKRINNNPHYKLRESITRRIRAALRSISKSKSGESVTKYLDYSFNDLREHIESQFEDWMTWDNWGMYKEDEWDDNDISTWTWQIDHIVPHYKFPYDSMNHPNFKKCWSLYNLRPLSAKKNFYDGVRRTR